MASSLDYEDMHFCLNIHATGKAMQMGMAMKVGADFEFEIPISYNCLIYLLNGEVNVNGEDLTGKEMVCFENERTIIHIQAKNDTRALLLSDEPIGEAIKMLKNEH